MPFGCRGRDLTETGEENEGLLWGAETVLCLDYTPHVYTHTTHTSYIYAHDTHPIYIHTPHTTHTHNTHLTSHTYAYSIHTHTMLTHTIHHAHTTY